MQEKVVDLISRTAPSIMADSTVANAALEMLEHDVHQLPVVDGDGKLLGIVRAEDLFGATDVTIEGMVRPASLTLPADISSYEAVRRMEESGVLYAVVTDEDLFLGLVTWQDVLRVFGD